MNRKKYFITGILLLVILQALDLFTTWRGTPDLFEEANAFVQWYGLGWRGLILVSIAIIVFVAIPFYYHAMVFNLPVYTQRVSSLQIFRNYFLNNHKNAFISIGKALFNAMGFLCFWWLLLAKFTAIMNNSFQLFEASFWQMSIEKKMAIMEGFEKASLFGLTIFFVWKIIQKAKLRKPVERSNYSISVIAVIIFFGLYTSFRLFIAFAKPVHSVELVNTIDPDIVLVNIGDGDRVSIANKLLAVDSCNPGVIGINAYFSQDKNGQTDSILINAFKKARHDIIGYHLDEHGSPTDIQKKFSNQASASGLLSYEGINGLVSRVTPVRLIDGKIYELFALQVIKEWHPGFKHGLAPNQVIPIKYTRTAGRFFQLESSQLADVEPRFLKNKIVLLGYLGPSDEDLNYTPVQLLLPRHKPGPDMYGVVILANVIRTILDNAKK